MVKVTFLGTNGWYDTETGNTPSVFVETDKEYIILDAGFGIRKAKDLVLKAKPVFLFLSHFHLDHIIGLHTLPIFNFPQGLDMYLPPNGEKVLRSILKKPFTSAPRQLRTRIRFHEFSQKPKLPFAFQYAPLRHSVRCYGFRFILEGRILTYCTDTGLCDNLKRLADSAEVLITECAMAPGEKGINLFHMTPETAARAAAENNVKKLALFHFDPGEYPTMEARSNASSAARRIFPETVVACDGTIIDL